MAEQISRPELPPMPDGGFVRMDLIPDDQIGVMIEGTYSHWGYLETARNPAADDELREYVFAKLVLRSLRGLAVTDPPRLRSLLADYAQSGEAHKQYTALVCVDSLTEFDFPFVRDTLAHMDVDQVVHNNLDDLTIFVIMDLMRDRFTEEQRQDLNTKILALGGTEHGPAPPSWRGEQW